MSLPVHAKESKPAHHVVHRPTPIAALTALGIVYGDLGTSPLYTMQTVVQSVGGKFTPDGALGILSLIVWALIITISIKYCVFVMRADNHGEGGILALMSLVGARDFGKGRALVIMGLFGAALIYGDGILTPAISVLSALEGVNVATDVLKPYVMPAAVFILLCLFGAQKLGTARIGKLFGPVMLVWFVVIAIVGAAGIARHPGVLVAIDPAYAVTFLAHGGWGGFAVLGGVFLALTGGEALYADMGHIGRNPIRGAWYCIVLPALLINYAGQTALLLEKPDMTGNPFFELVPGWALFPMVLLSTVATIIASQAIITGSFSLTRQAMQLGWFPGLRIRQTSTEEYGQIYVPMINWTMMLFTVLLTVVFGSSDRLAGAYGTAVSTTMLLTTTLLYNVMRERWRWPAAPSLVAAGVFLVVDFGFFAANLTKIADGGWIPLAFGSAVFIIMTTWHFGIAAYRQAITSFAEPPEHFFGRIKAAGIARVPGTAVYLTRTSGTTPPMMVQHVSEMGALAQSLVALTIKFHDMPRIALSHRLEIEQVSSDFWHITAHYGFLEIPDLPQALRRAKERGCVLDLGKAIYFGAHDHVIRAKSNSRLSRWRLPIFAFMFRNTVRAVDLFNLPPRSFVEIGHEVEI